MRYERTAGDQLVLVRTNEVANSRCVAGSDIRRPILDAPRMREGLHSLLCLRRQRVEKAMFDKSTPEPSADRPLPLARVYGRSDRR